MALLSEPCVGDFAPIERVADKPLFGFIDGL